MAERRSMCYVSVVDGQINEKPLPGGQIIK